MTPSQQGPEATIHPPTPASVASWFFPHEPEEYEKRAALREAIEELVTQAGEAALANYRAAREALALIRGTVEELAPPGSVTNSEQLGPDPMEEAEAIIRGVEAIAAAGRRGFV